MSLPIRGQDSNFEPRVTVLACLVTSHGVVLERRKCLVQSEPFKGLSRHLDFDPLQKYTILLDTQNICGKFEETTLPQDP
jgi:hypothetical protein